MRIAKTIELDEHSERGLRLLVKRRAPEARLRKRALVVLLDSEGGLNKDISLEADLAQQFALWRQCSVHGGIGAPRKDTHRAIRQDHSRHRVAQRREQVA